MVADARIGVQGMLGAVGGTPLVELRRVVAGSGARVFVKWEPANPTGSMKDRMAVEVIRSAAADGRLAPGETVVEYIEGIGIGFVPPLWHPELVDSIERVHSSEAQQMARRLAAEEGLFAGTSTGANIVAALRVADSLPSGARVVTVAADSGLRYLSTQPYA